MPGATFDRDARVFTVSQSWLQDFLRCPERARNELLRPSWEVNDATAVGTAMHLFMESRLHGDSFLQARLDATTWLDSAIEAEGFRFVKVKTADTMYRHLSSCIDGMERHVLRQVPQGGHIEETLRAELVTQGDWTVMLEGTPDYIDPFDRVWDWKSASSEYNVWETANWSIQPTSYTFLASCAATPREITEFTYAIAVKPYGSVQLIDTERGPREWEWLGRVSLGALVMCQRMLDMEWPVVHTHYLCDPKWCPVWDRCRGKYVSKPLNVGSAA